jgi:hypothetical protein
MICKETGADRPTSDLVNCSRCPVRTTSIYRGSTHPTHFKKHLIPSQIPTSWIIEPSSTFISSEWFLFSSGRTEESEAQRSLERTVRVLTCPNSKDLNISEASEVKGLFALELLLGIFLLFVQLANPLLATDSTDSHGFHRGIGGLTDPKIWSFEERL